MTTPTRVLAERLRKARTVPEALYGADRARPFVTMWTPGEERESTTLDFGGFLDQAEGYASALRAMGIGAGDAVVLILPQGIPLVALFAGTMLAGAVPAILATPTFKMDPEKYRSGLSGVTANIRARLVVIDEDFPPELRDRIVLPASARLVPLRELDAAASAAPRAAGRAGSPDPDSTAFIQHSAGTTGLQKAVALPHRSVLNQLAHLVEALEITPEDRIVSWLPLYHDMGLIACLALPLAGHIRLVMESPTDWVLRPGSLLALASEHRATLAWLPNFAFQFLARRVGDEERNGFDLSSMRAFINCSEPVSGASMDEFAERFAGCGLRPGTLAASYAMAENTFAVTQSPPGSREGPSRLRAELEPLRDRSEVVRRVDDQGPGLVTLTSSGRLLEGNEVRIVDAAGASLPDQRVGEIFVRSDSMLTGYLGRPDLTAAALVDGWYRTKDLGFLADGELFVTGRKDDLIIVGGKNLSPQDIEEIASAHPDVQDGRVAAFGVENRELGTRDLVVLAEAKDVSGLEGRERVESDVRRRVLAEIGVAPKQVKLLPPRWLVKSSAGKIARSTNRAKFLREFPELGYEEASAHESGRSREPGE